MHIRLKETIKSIVPAPAIRFVRDTKDKQELSSIEALNFQTASLKPAREICFKTAFHDPDITQSWVADHDAIKAIFGDEDLMLGVNPGDRRAIYHLIAALKPQRILEIGTHIAASTLYIAKASSAQIDTVDICDVNASGGPWNQIGLPRSPKDNLSTLGLENQVQFHSQGALPFMQGTDNRYDFIFLDGDHCARAVYQEIAAALKILNSGGLILLHDYYPDGNALFPDDNIIGGPWRATARVMRECPDLKILPLGNLPWPTKQGVNITSLALVAKQ